nr:DUF6241 domain-containing protein [uncultured Bacillus sp.]
MKRIIWFTLIFFALFCAGGAGTYTIIQDANEDHKDDLENGKPSMTVPPSEMTSESDINERLTEVQSQEKEQIAAIHSIKYTIDLPENATQDMVIDVMHQMTHQKIRAEVKEGAIPMSEDTINQVYETVLQSDFPVKKKLLEILSQWEIGNFSHIVSDHNYFWDYQGGTTGKAYGRLGLAEEEEFIRLHFSTQE